MKGKLKKRLAARKRKAMRVKSKIQGTAQRPRLVVYRSLRHIYAQLVDDGSDSTLASSSTLENELQESIQEAKSKCDASKLVGLKLAKEAQVKGIKAVVFDRNGNLYHGRVKALAEGAREGGIKF